MNNLYFRLRDVVHHLSKSRNKSGFSILDAVVSVAAILVLSAGGIVTFGAITENAKFAKTQAAAKDVYTAAIASLFDNDPLTTPASVADQYNNSNDTIRVSFRANQPIPIIAAMMTEGDQSENQTDASSSELIIDRASYKTAIKVVTENEVIDEEIPISSDNLCVTAVMISDEEISSSSGFCNSDSTNPDEENPGDGDGSGGEIIPPEEVIPPEPPYVWDDEAIMKTTWDTSIAANCQALTLPISNQKPGSVIDWGVGGKPVTLSSNPTYNYGNVGKVDITVSGKFDKWGGGSWLDSNCLTQVTQWGNTATTDINFAFSNANNLTFVKAIPQTVTSIANIFKDNKGNPDVFGVRTPNVKDMSGAFQNATNFNNLLRFETSNVTNMNQMFTGASVFNQPLNDWDTNKVTSMSQMFKGTSFNQSLNKWDTSNVINMHQMFFGAPFNQDLKTWDINNLVLRGFMFSDPNYNANLSKKTHSKMLKFTYQCDVNTVGSLPLRNAEGQETWHDGDTKFVTTQNGLLNKSLQAGVKYEAIFEGKVSYLTTQYSSSSTALAGCLRSVDYWGEGTNLADLNNGFQGSYNLISVPDNIPSTVRHARNAFFGATSFNSPNVSKWNTSNFYDFSGMFNGATSFNQPLNNWNVSLASYMDNMFTGASSFNQPLNDWDVSRVTSMKQMFKGSGFNQSLNKWNTSNVTNMHQMFFEAPFNQDLSSWDTNKVTLMGLMFTDPNYTANMPRTTHSKMTRLSYRCDVTSSGSIPIIYGSGNETWSDGTTKEVNTGSSTLFKTLKAGVNYTVVFEGTYSTISSQKDSGVKALAGCLRSVDYWGRDTGTADATEAFRGAYNLISVPTSVSSSLNNMRNMLLGATSFNDPNVGEWDVSKVYSMSGTFNGATSFNQPLNNWNTSRVSDMSQTFMGSGFNQPLSKWNTSEVITMHQMFLNAPFKQDLSAWDMNKVTLMGFMFNDADYTANLPKTTHSKMLKMTYQCNTTTFGSLPFRSSDGTETWSDGATKISNSGSGLLGRYLQAGVKYKVVYEGSIHTLNTQYDSTTKGLAGCIRSIDHWGSNTKTAYADNGFSGSYNLVSIPDNIPSTITSINSMFKGATSLNDSNIKNWDVSKIKYMDSMFSGATSFKQNISNWDTSSLVSGKTFAPSDFPDSYLPAKTSK